MEAVDDFTKIESVFVRHRNALVLRGQFTPIYTDYYLHLMQHRMLEAAPHPHDRRSLQLFATGAGQLLLQRAPQRGRQVLLRPAWPQKRHVPWWTHCARRWIKKNGSRLYKRSCRGGPLPRPEAGADDA